MQLLAETWQREPDAVAVEDRDGRLTRRELEAEVRGLAARLVAAGVQPGDIVAVYVERSVQLVVAQVAVLFAGAAHVAIDPDDPPQRLGYLLDDSRPSIVLCSERLRDRLPKTVRTLVRGSRVEGPADLPIAAADDGAYLIYTSGSTGAPKASLITHRALVSRLRWLQDFCPLTDADVVLYKTACGFDVSVAELYWTLTAGGLLYCARPGVQRDTDYLAAVVAKQRVSVLHFVPSLLDLFLASRPEDERYESVRLMLAGGEVLSPALVRRWQARSPGTLLNMYGPSECAVYTTAWACPDPLGDQPVMIGSAAGETGLWVLDEDSRAVTDLNASGELLVTGAGLAREYVGRPDLTAERFVSLAALNPELPAERAYRTGDLVAWSSPGVLAYRGRVDRQVKIRGHRIELEEIEVVASSVPSVSRAAAVVVRGQDTQELHLFLVPVGTSGGGPDLETTARELLRDRLPAYMQPRDVHVIDGLPLSPNGKLDDALLGELVAATAPAVAAKAEQADPLANRWAALLGVPADADCDFFLAGGDSFTAVRLLKQLSEDFGQRLPLRLLMQHPVFGDFHAALVEHVAAGHADAS